MILIAVGCIGVANGKSEDFYSIRGEAYQFDKVLELYDAKLINQAEQNILSHIKQYDGPYSEHKQLMLLAEIDLYNNNFKLADRKLEDFEHYYTNSPFLSSAVLYRAYIAFQLKDFENAEKHFQKAFNIAVDDYNTRKDSIYNNYAEEAIYWRGVSLYHLGRYNEAQTSFLECNRNYPNSKYSDDALYALGMISEINKNFDKAISYYKTLSSKYPYSNYIVSSKIREANNYLILRDPSNAIITLDNLSNILERVNNNKDDGNKYEKQVNLENSDEEVIYLKAEAYNLYGNYSEAEKYYNLFIEKYPDSRIINYVRLGLGRIFLEKNDYNGAIAKFDDIITSGIELNQSLLSQAKLLRAVAQKKSGNLKDAKKEFLALSLQPDFALHSDAMYELALIYYEERDYTKSIKTLIDAEKRAEDAQQKIKLHLLLGANYLEEKQWPDALNIYRSAEQLAQKSSDVYLAKRNWYIGEARLKQGIALVNLAKYREAIFPLQTFIADHKDDPRLDEATFWLSEAFYRANMIKNASENYNKLITKFPNSKRVEESYYGLAWTYFRQQKFNESSKIFDQMMKLFPNSKFASEVYSRQGDGYYLTKRFTEAVSAYQKALKVSEDSDEGQYCSYQIAHSYFKMGSYDQAVTALLNFVKRYPKSSYSDNALYLVGWIYFQRDRYTESIERFKYLLEVYPQSSLVPNAQYSIGDAYYNLGNFDAAITEYKKVIEKYPSSDIAGDALRSIQYALESLGRTDDAIAITDVFIKANPESPFAEDLRMKKGELFYSGKKYSDAISEYNEFVKAFPKSEKNPEVYYWMAKSYLNIGDTVNTLKMFEEVYTRFPESEYAPMSFLESGLFYKDINRIIQAETQFNELVKRYPENSMASQALFEVSTIRISIGDTTDGINLNKKILTEYPESEYAVLSRYRLATFYKLKNNMDSAIVHYAILAKNELNTVVAAESAYRLGEYYKYIPNYPEAIKWYSYAKDNFSGIEDWYSLSLLSLGECYERTEDYISARDIYSALSQLRKDDEYGNEAARRLKSILKK